MATTKQAIRSDIMKATKNPRTQWVTAPTIASLREALNMLESEGMSIHESITITHLANELGTFVIEGLSDKVNQLQEATK